MSEPRIVVRPRTANQEQYLQAIRDNSIVLCTGYAGSGKTFLALAEALRALKSTKGKVRRIVIIRPYMASNTGERVGYLPGNLEEKVGPYIEGIKDNLRQLLKLNEVEITKMLKEHFEFTVLSMCRGRSFNDCFVIVEEAQNVPLDGDAMKMLLTRVGTNCKMVIAGDIDQCDIDSRDSGLVEALNVMDGMNGVGIVEMHDYEDIQRSPLVREILQRFDNFRKTQGK